MQVLVVYDQDGHCHVFDISTPEQEKRIIFAMIEGWMEHGDGNGKGQWEEVADEMRQAIASGDLDRVYELWDDTSDVPTFDRSGGGILYKVNVETEWSPTLGRNVG